MNYEVERFAAKRSTFSTFKVKKGGKLLSGKIKNDYFFNEH